jgi:hypothetical protein
MKLRKYGKIVLVLFLIGIIATSLSVVFGAEIPTAGSDKSGAASSVQSIVGALIFIIQIIAFAAAVIMLMFLGIKYITASPDGKAEIKKSSVHYVVGAIILFAATGILQIVRNFALSNIKSGS